MVALAQKLSLYIALVSFESPMPDGHMSAGLSHVFSFHMVLQVSFFCTVFCAVRKRDLVCSVMLAEACLPHIVSNINSIHHCCLQNSLDGPSDGQR